MSLPEPATVAEMRERYRQSCARLGLSLPGTTTIVPLDRVRACSAMEEAEPVAAPLLAAALPPGPPALAAPTLADIVNAAEREGGRPRSRAIIAAIAREHDLHSEDLVGPRRSKWVVDARHRAMAAVHLYRPDLSLPQIGRLFGDRDHTTVLSALRKSGSYRCGRPL